MVQSKSKAGAPGRGPGRPSAKNQPDLKKALLVAAVELFGARGYDGVSLGQIAKLAGADIGLMRYYFGSKSAVWEAAILYLIEQFSEEFEVDELDLSDSPSNLLKHVIRAFVSASSKWPQLSRIIVFDGDSSDERGEFISQQLVGPFFAILSDLIAGSKAEGAISDVDTRTIFFMITHGGSFPMALPALTNAFPGGDIQSKPVLDQHADAIITLIFKDGFA